ncbi:HalOD1 output domain-containing protein [Natronobacterium texcoconense]|uniref:Halobacterial output domain-containing protein n=1 Tax=Natronobacterium texcoconense TaxID=1095778 RepID=A0A1H0ZCR3_NATTX|nr:HalOD1 output domain-containing protein [Natronobacterium texcoconense]SDQ25217.1 hypothetical protein SAMN04489842_0229 [Natronobacterium texcoconense]
MEKPPYAVEYEYDAEVSPSIAVVRTICALEGVEPMEMPAESGFVLHEHTDPNALDELLAGSSGDGSTVVSLEIALESAYIVDLTDDGRIIVHRDHAPKP